MSIENLVKPHIAKLEPYPPGKPVEELERELGITGAIKLASNENPLGPSPKAVAAMRAALENVNRYPDGGSFRLRAKLAARLGFRRAGEWVHAARGLEHVYVRDAGAP